MIARKGDWVLIEQVYLMADQRQSNLPKDTQAKDFTLRIKGFLSNETSEVGHSCLIVTKTGRHIEGRLLEVFPSYRHSFGDYLKETEYIESQLKNITAGNRDE